MAALPEPLKSLRAELESLREQIRQLRNRSPFFGTGMHTNGNGGIDSDNYIPATSGFSLNGETGVAEFKDVILYDLPNSMLASPIVPYVGHAQGNNFNVPTTNTAVATLTVPVPSGYSRAMVTAHAHVSAYNPNGGSDYLFAVAWIQTDTTIGWSMPVTVGAAASATTSQTATALVTGISTSFTVKVATSCVNTAFTTSTSGNVANIDATVLFLR